MRRRGWSRFSLFLAVFSLVAFAADRDSDREIADRLIAEALKPSSLETNLRRFSDEIGGRIHGTPAFQGATGMTASLYSGTTLAVHAVSVAWVPGVAAATHGPSVDVVGGSAAEVGR